MAEAEKTSTVTVKNICPGPRGLHTVDGLKWLDPQAVDKFTMTETELAGAKSTGYFEFGRAATDAKPKEGPAAPSVVYVAKHRGGGAYSIMKGDEEVKSGLSKEDAEAFNGLTPEDQAAYVAPAPAQE